MIANKGLSVDRVTEIFNDFMEKYNGNIDVIPIVKSKQEDIYGEENSIEKSGVVISGAFHPAKRIVALIASNLDNEEEVKTTLRHELLGHNGLNTFEPEDKLGLLLHVRATEKEPSLNHVWKTVNTFYPNKSGLEKAEEVFAYVAEEERTFFQSAWDSVCSTLNKLLRKSGLVDKRLTKSDLRVEARKIAKGIMRGQREQRTFPATDVDQFRLEVTDMKNEKKPFHETVAEKIIKQLEEGTAPWQKPWNAEKSASFLPYNPTTGNRYKGINALHLMASNREDQRWLTYRQASDLGAQVKKGEKSTTVQYWKFTEDRIKLDEKTGKPVLDKDGKKQKETVKLERPRVFYASVFNAEQIDNMPAPEVKKEQQWNPIERAEKILASSGAVIKHSQHDNAFYRPIADEIHLPKKEAFDSADKYYATALHELGHWTGHSSRLDRPMSNPFGSEGYAKEELRAEISSMLLGEELEIGHDPEQHTAYVGSWIKALKEDPLEIFRAAADAEKITGFVLALENKQVIEQAPQEIELELRQRIIEQGAEELSKNKDIDNNALKTYLNIVNIAEQLGFDTTLSSPEKEMPFETIVINYSKGNIDYPVSTELSINDGKAATSVNGERVNGSNFTSELDWQNDALVSGLASAEKNMLHSDASLKDKNSLDIPKVTVNSSNTINSLAFTIENLKDVKTQFDGVSLDSALASTKLDANIEVLSDVMEERQNGKEESSMISDEYIKDKLSLEQYEAWENVKETSLLKGVIPSLSLDGDTINISFSPSTMFDDVSATIVEQESGADVIATFKGEEKESLEEALEAVLLSIRIKHLESEAKTESNIELHQANEIQQNNSSANITDDKHYIDVPFKEKNEAKKLGARWDKEEKSWYVPPSFDLTPFEKWNTNSSTETKDEIVPETEAESSEKEVLEKTFLAVPYEERGVAKAAGAKWDTQNKSWYADNENVLEELQQYLPNNNTASDPAQRPEDEFKDFLIDMKVIVDGEHPIMDGTKQRIKVEGDKNGEKSGNYVAYLDGKPNAVFNNHRTGQTVKWKAKGYSLSAKEKAELSANAAIKIAKREAETAKKYAVVSEDLTRFFKLSPVAAQHGYLDKKGVTGEETRIATKTALAEMGEDSRIKVASNLKEAKELREQDKSNIVFVEGDLLIPAKDTSGKIWSLQSIQASSFKSFATGGKKSENFCALDESLDMKDCEAFIVCEGYATGKSVEEGVKGTKAKTIVAFDSNNLLPVVETLKAQFPDKPIIVAGEDDRKAELKPPHFKNVGKEKSKEAAEKVNGLAILPVFAKGEAENGLTDFNDLAAKSKLGKEAVKRQLMQAINKVMSKAPELKSLVKTEEVKVKEQRKVNSFLEHPQKKKVASR